MKKVVFLVMILTLGACGWWYEQEIQDWLNPPQTERVFYGNVEDRQVNLAFSVSERISEILVEEGVTVKKGDLVGTLETVRIEKEVAVAQRALKVAQQNLVKAHAGSRAEEIAMSSAGLSIAEARIKPAKNDYTRQLELQKSGAVSHQEIDNAEAIYLMRLSEADLARENLKMRKAGTRKEDIDIVKAQVEQAETELARLEQRLADTKLYAPCDGVVRRRVLEPGEMASPQFTVLKLAVTDPKWVRVYLPERLLSSVKLNAPANIHSDGWTKNFDGWVGFISPSAEFTPKNVETPELRTSLVYECRVYVKDPDNRLKLGAPVTVTLP